MMGMVKGAEVITGVFSTSITGKQKITFGRTLSRYFFIFELTDQSKQALMLSGNTNPRGFMFFGVYPPPNIDSNDINTIYSGRVIPNTGELSSTTTSVILPEGDGLSVYVGTGNSSVYIDYDYNYTIIAY